jgi:hypothetical protein
MKYLLNITVLGMIVITLFSFSSCGSKKDGNSSVSRVDLATIEYRNDIDPITSRFTKLQDINYVYWKAGFIGRADFGPTSYFIKGFLVLSDSETNRIIHEYKFEPLETTFESGIDPAVTGYSNFSWGSSSEYSKTVLENKFIGEILFDQTNGIIYIDVENT